jgi:hypothetical protein
LFVRIACRDMMTVSMFFIPVPSLYS